MTLIDEDPPWEQPSHPDSIRVHRILGSFSSHATSLISLPAGSFFCKVEDHFFIPERSWISVEVPGERHIDLNSDIVFFNHSCNPSLELDVTKWEVRVSRNRDLHKGDPLTWFYPSTEWQIVQPFDCFCGDRKCLHEIVGASRFGKEALRGYWLNDHIKDKFAQQEKGKEQGAPSLKVDERLHEHQEVQHMVAQPAAV